MNEYKYYDYDDFEKLNAERSRKLMDLYRRWHSAKEKGNEKTMKKTIQTISKHKAKDEELKEMASKVWYRWY